MHRLPLAGSAPKTAVSALRGGGRFTVGVVLLSVTVLLVAVGGCAPGVDPATGPADLPRVAERLDPPAAPGAMAPELVTVDGRLALLWLEPAEAGGTGGHRLRFARLGRDGWTEPVTVAGPGEPFFVNWADRPQVVEGGDGSLVATWLAKNGDTTYAYEVRAARSDDGGATWRPLGRLHGDAQPAEHGFVSLIAEADGVRAVWLDGRNTPDGEPMALYTGLVGAQEAPAEGADVAVARNETPLDTSVCDCCDTAVTRAGDSLIVAYRDRSGEEIRDISVVRSSGDGWSEPVKLADDGWQIAACPVNGPALASSGETVWAVWYTAAEGVPRVLGSVSPDGGASFSAPQILAGGEDSESPPLGRVDLVATGAGDALAVWLDTRGGTAEIRAARLAADGSVSEPVRLVASDTSRASGVPRLAAVGDALYLAWVEPGGDTGDGGLRLARLASPPRTAAADG